MTALSILIVLFGLFSLTIGTPFYLQSLLTTTVPTAPSHISDFRKQPRSDSRADKPDQFPNFDFTIETTTARRRKTAAEHYTTIFGRIIGNHRHNLGKLLKNVEMHHERRQQRLQQQQAVSSSTSSSPSIMATINSNDVESESDDFESGLNVEDNDYNNDIDDSVIITENATAQNSHHPIFNNKYVSILLGKIGYTNETAGELHRNITNRFISSSTTVAKKYILNPLIIVWNSARNSFQLKGHQIKDGMISDTSNNSSDEEILNDKDLSTEKIALLKIMPVISDESMIETDAENINAANETASVVIENDNIAKIDDNNNKNGVIIDSVNRIDDIDGPDMENNSYENNGFIGAAENVGIFILELFGTVAALSWGAFSQITAG